MIISNYFRIFAADNKKITIMTAFDNITANEKLDAALAKFHKDWGGEGSAMEIAQQIRQGADMVRVVPAW